MLTDARKKTQEQDIDQMTREELINLLLQKNPQFTFRFTSEWLHRQRACRLRKLLQTAREGPPFRR